MNAQRRLRSAWTSAQSDQSLLSAWRKFGSLATRWAHSEDWSDWADAQADLSLRWAHSHIVGFVMRPLIFIFMFSDRQYRPKSDSAPSKSSLISVYIACHSVCYYIIANHTESFFNGVQIRIFRIWAASRQNQLNDCAPSEDSDQPGHSPSLISLRCPHEESLGP